VQIIFSFRLTTKRRANNNTRRWYYFRGENATTIITRPIYENNIKRRDADIRAAAAAAAAAVRGNGDGRPLSSWYTSVDNRGDRRASYRAGASRGTDGREHRETAAAAATPRSVDGG